MIFSKIIIWSNGNASTLGLVPTGGVNYNLIIEGSLVNMPVSNSVFLGLSETRV
jgi:hypothetical protein